jgi:hypothetical protein
METQHTRGEWHIEYTEDYLEPKCSRIEIHSKNSGGWICKVQNNGIIENDEGQANAKLIAASPLLLEALQRALNDFKSQRWTEETYKVIEQAINKAIQ